MTNSETLGHVMLIDDEKFDRKMYQRVLEKTRVADKVTSFAYAEEAVNYLADPANPRVDLILLDINMPRMNGFEFLDAVQEQFGAEFDAMIAVMLSIALTPKDQKRAADSPMINAFFSKPLTVQDIHTAVRMVNARRELAALRNEGLMAVSSPALVSAKSALTARPRA